MSPQDDSSSDLDSGATLRAFGSQRRVFDRYELREILGRGGMGVVWRAFDEQLEREVALKFLPEMVAFDEQAISDLKRETRKTQELRHHHIVQVYDFVTDRRSACIAMEFVDVRRWPPSRRGRSAIVSRSMKSTSGWNICVKRLPMLITAPKSSIAT